MKKILLLTVCAFIATPAFAAKEESNYAHQAMGCKLIQDKASCVGKISGNYCESYNAFPKDVQKVLALQFECHSMGAALSGNEKNDVKIIEAAEKAGCGTVDADTLTVVRTHWESRDIATAILFFEDEYHKAVKGCEKKS